MPSGTDIRSSSAARDPSRTELDVASDARSASAPSARDAMQDTMPAASEQAPAGGQPQEREDSARNSDEDAGHARDSAGLGPEALVLVAAATDPPWLTRRPGQGPAEMRAQTTGGGDLGLADTYHGAPSSKSESEDRPGTDEIDTLGTDSEMASTAPASRSARPRRSRQLRYRRGAAIGRYIVLDTVGAGTMGTVYAAYDPELDRRIAVKLLATNQSRSLKARLRLLREARALARLSHPNVIQVYDVGVQNDEVFVAMELIEGESLHAMTHAQPRPAWRNVLRWYVEAARGLAAAHAVGQIHRDFKPSNVLIGRDSRVRVADFGLAAAVHRDLTEQTDLSVVAAGGDISAASTLADAAPPGAAGPQDEDDEETGLSSPGFDAHITDPGTVMGTPAFMAPEQHSGGDVGPHADQYSFCVALYAGLYGELPFSAADAQRPMVELFTQKVREQIAPPPPDTDVPEWLRSVVLRGLRAQPEQRWPSMAALIAALEDDPVVRRRRTVRTGAAIVALVMLTGLTVFGWLRTPGIQLGAACRDSQRQLAGVWDQDVRQAIRASFLATARPYAQATFDRVSGILDRYAADWAAMRTEACEATRVREEQSEQTLDLRMYCLRQRQSRLQALTQILAQDASPEVLDGSIRAAMDLPGVAHCGDIDALMAKVPPPEDRATRAVVESLEARLDRADALADSAGRYRDALVEAMAALDQSKSVSYLPIQARAMFSAAKLRRRVGDTAAAEALLRELIPLAARVRDDALAARAWAELLWSMGYVEGRHQDALDLALAAQAAVERTGDELLRAELWLTLGAIVYSMGEYGRAAEYEARALDAQERTLGPKHPTVAQALNNLAASLTEMDDPEAARPLHERALAIRTEILGASHPLVAQSMMNLARTLAELGEVDQALELHQRAVTGFEASLGPAHWLVGAALNSQGHTLLQKGEHEQARVVFERALAVREAAQGRNHPALADSLIGLGEVYLAQANPEAALRWFERALVIGENAGKRTLARARFGRAQALWSTGRERDLALDLAGQALTGYQALGLARAAERVRAWLDGHAPGHSSEPASAAAPGAAPATPAPR
jgi:serine/threonine protein kinase/tetratricopeptide (TPR) repeat protein